MCVCAHVCMRQRQTCMISFSIHDSGRLQMVSILATVSNTIINIRVQIYLVYYCSFFVVLVINSEGLMDHIMILFSFQEFHTVFQYCYANLHSKQQCTWVSFCTTSPIFLPLSFYCLISQQIVAHCGFNFHSSDD